MATEIPRDVVLGGGGNVGKREADKEVTAKILLSVVSGSWGSAADSADESHVSLVGMKGCGVQNAAL